MTWQLHSKVPDRIGDSSLCCDKSLTKTHEGKTSLGSWFGLKTSVVHHGWEGMALGAGCGQEAALAACLLQHMEWCLQHSEWDFPLHLNLSGNTLIDIPRGVSLRFPNSVKTSITLIKDDFGGAFSFAVEKLVVASGQKQKSIAFPCLYRISHIRDRSVGHIIPQESMIALKTALSLE